MYTNVSEFTLLSRNIGMPVSRGAFGLAKSEMRLRILIVFVLYILFNWNRNMILTEVKQLMDYDTK